MRYFDISSRAQVISLLDSVTVAHNGSRTYHAGSSPTAAMPYVDRTGYYSYILHFVVTSGLTAASVISISAKMQSATDVTSASTWSSTCADFTSLQSTAGVKDAYYKQLYLNTTGTTAHYNKVGTTAFPAGWRDQCSTVDTTTYGCKYTAITSESVSYPVVFDCRLVGSLRSDEVVGKYIAPYITVKDNEGSSDVTFLSASLILGAGDTMPVMEGGTAGTNNYYSKGQ